MKKITLIFPNYLIREKFGDPSDPPLGIAYIGAVLEEKNYNVSIIDANAENLTLDGISARLKIIKPDIVGICCNYSPLHNPTIQIAAMIKKDFKIPIIVGGNHATALDEYMLKSSGDIDLIVRGEGEAVFLNLMEGLQQDVPLHKIKGITYRKANIIVKTQDQPSLVDLDMLPMPAYHLLPMDKYRRYNIIASRGCPFDCSYCASKVIFKNRVRYRSPSKVVDEIEYLLRNYGKKQFWFSDDTFISNPKYTNLLLKELMIRDLNITWSCLTRIDMVGMEMLKKMKDSGCNYISYGIESGNQEMLNKMNKRITVNEIITTLKLTNEIGIKQYGFFIVGYPGEKWKTVMDSYKLIYHSKLNGAVFNILIPLPGTKLISELINNNIIKLDELRWDHLFARTPNEKYEPYSAKLASKWCELSGIELMEACIIGNRTTDIFRHVLKNF